MKKLFLASLALIPFLRGEVNKDDVQLPKVTGKIVASLELDIVALNEKQTRYPAGLGLRVKIKNVDKKRHFIHFDRVMVTLRKENEPHFFYSIHGGDQQMIVPPSISSKVNIKSCYNKPRNDLAMMLQDSLHKRADYDKLFPSPLFEDAFFHSILFLEPDELFECVFSITGLLLQHDSFEYKGRYRFLVEIENSENLFTYGIKYRTPKVYKGFEKCSDNLKSNELIINLR